MLNKFSPFFLVLGALFGSLLFKGSDACAATFTQIEQLYFGQFGYPHNAGPARIVIAPNGEVTYEDGIIPLADGAPAQRGEYLLEDFPPHIIIVPQIDSCSPLELSGGTSFVIHDFETNTPETDDAGAAMLYVGAILETDGSGVVYDSGTYTGTCNFTFNF